MSAARRSAAALLLATVLGAVAPVPVATASTAGRAAPPAAVAPATPAELAAAVGRRVSAALSTAGPSTIGAAVDVEGLGPALRRNAGSALRPASNQKNFTVATALLTTPATRRLHTTVAAVAPTSATGRVSGSLWLVAGGDPHLTAARLRELARAVRASGVREVTGDLRLDDYRYDAARSAPGWKSSHLPYQSGPLSAMALDGNRWRSDAAYLLDPALPAAARFKAMLAAEGVEVRGSVLRSPRPGTAHRVARVSSVPLPELAARVLKPSDNFAAELLLKEIGRYDRGVGSTASGLAVVRRVLTERGVPVGAMADGSGLSAYDRQSPAGELALLRAVESSPVAAAFRAALPVACVDGTLRTRLCDTPAAGNATAKTGTLTGVRTLNGWVRTHSGRTASYAFLINDAADPTRARAAIDAATAALAAAPE